MGRINIGGAIGVLLGFGFGALGYSIDGIFGWICGVFIAIGLTLGFSECRR